MCVCMLSCIQLFVTLWTATFQAPVSMGFPRQESWSRLPFPPPGYLPDPGIEPHGSCFSYVGRWILYHWVTWEANIMMLMQKEDSGFFFWGFCFICPFESCFFLFTRHTEVIHCLYIFVNVNWVIPNAFPIIKIATLKIIVLCYLC